MTTRNDHDSGETADLTILIPTLVRPESLQLTLDALTCELLGTRVEVVVIENGRVPSLDPTSLHRTAFARVRLLHEAQPGKSAALNRAIAVGGLAPLIAVLDDDMTPAPGWCGAVVRSASIRPMFDVFAGRSHVIWPTGVARPSWSEHGLALGIAFSVIDLGAAECEMGSGVVGFPSGNHYWFRRTVLDSVPSYPLEWPHDMDFVLRVRLAGHRGVFVPEVSCGHRIQPGLLSADAFLDRAARFGHAAARVESLSRAVRPPSRVRAGARLGRSCAHMAAWSVAGLAAVMLTDRVGVPLQASARCQVARNRARFKRSWDELVRKAPPRE